MDVNNTDENKNTIDVSVENEMKKSYITYAMSVIISRALPNVYDGLKPVQRRILYSMYQMNLFPGAKMKKSARIIGDVLGKYHPHGESSIYGAFVRMAQDFSMRVPTVLGQGNFGSVDGDPPASIRYTEGKMTKYGMEMLRDIEKDTVNFTSNFDDSLKEPEVLPSFVPNILVNGSTGIAVGMATNIPTHNLGEIVQAICHLIDNPDCNISDLFKYINGPDFPTGGIIVGVKGIRDAYNTGRGRIIVRGKLHFENIGITKSKSCIIIDEIPYQVVKSQLIIQIADLVNTKKIEGIHNIRDESDRRGMRVVIELKKGYSETVVENQLYKMSSLQRSYSIMMLALLNRRPKIFNIKEILENYLEHRIDILVRKYKYDLNKASNKLHLLEGLYIAICNIDKVIQIIKSSNDTAIAHSKLKSEFKLSDKQAGSILEMRLNKLTNIETNKILNDIKDLKELIKLINEILSDKSKQLNIISDSLKDIFDKYKSKRKTSIIEEEFEPDSDKLIKEEENIVVLSNIGFIKRVTADTYKIQRRGGKGIVTTSKKVNEFTIDLFALSTHDYLIFFSNLGRAFYLKVYSIPESNRISRGRNLQSILSLEENEIISGMLKIPNFSTPESILFITQNGIIKKSSANAFVNAKSKGIKAIRLDKDDKLISTIITDNKSELLICTMYGKALKIVGSDVRITGRGSRGVVGIRMKKDDKVIGVAKVTESNKLFIITRNGYGKVVKFNQFKCHGRGTGGQLYMKTNDKTGFVASICSVFSDDNIIITTKMGMTMKTNVSGISNFSRTAGGSKIININEDDSIVAVSVSNTDI